MTAIAVKLVKQRGFSASVEITHALKLLSTGQADTGLWTSQNDKSRELDKIPLSPEFKNETHHLG